MEITIQSIHFETSEKLNAFIRKKVSRLPKFNDDVFLADVTLKVIKPEANDNKDASIRLHLAGIELFAQEVANTFEEAVDQCVHKLERQVVKHKEKQRSKK
jgi:putative sigma-54 modulation protein